MYDNLQHFIKALEEAGELKRIKTTVDPFLEIGEITDRISKMPGGGKALLFEDTGTSFPVLTNMMGSERRICLALGVDSLDQITERIETIAKKAMSPMESLADKLRVLPLLGEMSRWFPRKIQGRGECQNTILKGAEAELDIIPILQCWPCDGGRFVTLPLVNTIDPETGVRNVGMYRMQQMGKNMTGMHWHIHKTGERHYRGYQKLGKRMPVSVCIGGDPIYTYAATAPMPDNMDEYLLAGFLRKKAVKLVKCITNDIYVPSDCDFVIEGYVDPQEEKVIEGPFGDHTGFYSLEDLYPVFHVTAITHRKDPVYPATLVGVPPQEDAYIAKATEKIFLAPIRLALHPEVDDLFMPPAGVAHNLALVSINKTFEGQAFKVASSLWGAGQMMFNKIMIVAPAGTDLRNKDSISGLLRNVDITRDVVFSRGVLDVLDHSPETSGVGGKMVIDLTVNHRERNFVACPEITLPEWAVSADLSYVHDWGLLILRCDHGTEANISGFVSENLLDGINFIVFLDSSTEILNDYELLWFALGNTDPSRDIKIVSDKMVIDARIKIPYKKGYPERVPNVVVSSPETITLVDVRWKEYGFEEKTDSPSARYNLLCIGDKAEI